MRKPRILLDGAVYHVTARANRQEMILAPEEIKELFLDVLRRAKNRFKFKMENFCIMGNHIHLMIRPTGTTSLSRLMQWILSVFAMAYNRKLGVTGHVWGERFFSRIIAGLAAYVKTFGYIDQNPVAALLLTNFRCWRFGGLWENRAGIVYVCEKPGPLITMLFPEHAQLLLG